MKRLVVTGYKPYELGIFNDKHPGLLIIKKAIQDKLLQFIDEGLEWVIVSGQLGVEQWSIEVFQSLKKDYPHLRYAVITPFLDPHQNWNEQNQEKFQKMISQADYHVSLTSKGYEAPWQFREKDAFLIRNSDGILFVYDLENEGSPIFMKKLVDQYVENHPYEVHMITADDLNLIAEEEQFKRQIESW